MKGHVRVYRIEALKGDLAGHGPYRYHSAEDGKSLSVKYQAFDLVPSWNGETHPTPQEDGIGEPRPDEFCAFTSKRALRKWWHSGALRLMCSTGFYGVVSYVVPREDVRRGRVQVVFRKDRAVERHVFEEIPR